MKKLKDKNVNSINFQFSSNFISLCLNISVLKTIRVSIFNQVVAFLINISTVNFLNLYHEKQIKYHGSVHLTCLLQVHSTTIWRQSSTFCSRSQHTLAPHCPSSWSRNWTRSARCIAGPAGRSTAAESGSSSVQGFGRLSPFVCKN